MISPIIPAPRSGQAPFVVFEGLDAVGKSTTASLFAEAIGAELLATPDDELAAARRELEPWFEEHPNARMLWYAATVVRVSDRVAACLREGRPAVVDRYFLSTLAYAELRGATLRLDEVERALVAPDFTVFLHAPVAIRAARMNGRHLQSKEDVRTLDPANDARLERAYRRHAERRVAGNVIDVDTSERSPSEIARHLVERLAIHSTIPFRVPSSPDNRRRTSMTPQ